MSEQNYPPSFDQPNTFQPIASPLIMRGYRDPGWISFITVFFIVLTMISDFAVVPVNLATHTVLTRIQEGSYETEEEMTVAAETSDLINGITAIVRTLISVVAGILFLVWTYRIVKNAHLISFRPLRFSPGWAIGYYFIPILNLFRPYQALSDARRASDNPGDWMAALCSHLLGWWSVR
jgi:hypothetical protein